MLDLNPCMHESFKVVENILEGEENKIWEETVCVMYHLFIFIVHKSFQHYLIKSSHSFCIRSMFEELEWLSFVSSCISCMFQTFLGVESIFLAPYVGALLNSILYFLRGINPYF